MEHRQLIEALIRLGNDSGVITVCEQPTPAQVRAHFVNLVCYAVYFLAPFLLG